MIMKNITQKDINRPRPRRGQKNIKYKMFLGMVVFRWIKQNLSSIWGLIHEKVKQHWGRVEKSMAYKKCLFQKPDLLRERLNL